MIIGQALPRGIQRPAVAPFGGGQFRFNCTLGTCLPADGVALAAVQTLNKKLGLAAPARSGLTMAHVHAVNGLGLPGLRTFVHTADLARHIGTVVQTLTFNRADLDGWGALGAALGEAPPSVSARAVFAAAQQAARAAEAKRKGPPTIPPSKQRPASVLVKPKQYIDDDVMPRLSKAQIVALQRALTRAGHPTPADGKLGPKTLTAVRNWQAARGRISEVENTTYDTISVFYKSLMTELTRGDAQAATGAQKPTPTGATKPVATANTQARQVVLPKGYAPVGDYGCKAGVCKPMSDQAAKTAVALQQLLLSFPPGVTRYYPAGFKVDGIIGAHTTDALKQVLRAAARRKGVSVDEKLMKEITAANVVGNIDSYVSSLTSERQLQVAVAAQGATAGPGLVYKMSPKGTATGNEAFRCYGMALQVQLNRMNQRIALDGVIGQNTAASVNAVFGDAARKLGKPWVPLTVQGIANELQDMIKTAKSIADRSGAPAPDPRTMRMAVAKCKLESKQPVVDARLFQGEPVTTPTAPPSPVPAPPGTQPVPQIEKANVPDPFEEDLQSLKKEAVYRGLSPSQADEVVRGVRARGGGRPDVVGALNAAIQQREAAKDQYPANVPEPKYAEPSGLLPEGAASPRVPVSAAGMAPAEPEGPIEAEPAMLPAAAERPRHPDEIITSKDRTWMWIVGGLAGLGVIGGGLYFATRKRARRR
jgi:lysozyme family protein